MAKLPESVIAAIDALTTPCVFTTVDAQGMPNTIYCMPLMRAGDDMLIVADNYFAKTRANAQNAGVGTILFMTPEWKAYQVKGTLSYETSGPHYEQMHAMVDPKHPRIAAVVLHVEAVFSGAEQLA